MNALAHKSVRQHLEEGIQARGFRITPQESLHLYNILTSKRLEYHICQTDMTAQGTFYNEEGSTTRLFITPSFNYTPNANNGSLNDDAEYLLSVVGGVFNGERIDPHQITKVEWRKQQLHVWFTTVSEDRPT